MQDQNKLIVYHDSVRLALELERDMAKAPRGFGTKRRQLLDAAWSVSANISEGCGASTNPDFARFLDNAIKSLKEVEHHVLAAHKLDVISMPRFEELDARITLLRRQLFTLVRKVRAKDNQQ